METFKNCEKCGKEFSGERWHISRRKYCSHECYSAATTQDITGMTFGRYTVLSKGNGKLWNVICSCGTKNAVAGQTLKSGKAQSCGCLQKELARGKKTTHGGSRTRAHTIWQGIIQRCTNPNFKQWADYGGRGITVCDRWRDYKNFQDDMGQPPDGFTIERLDNSVGYFKENCVWATRSEQQRNRRTNVLIEFNGKTKCQIEWAEHFGLSEQIVTHRIRNKWTLNEVFGIDKRPTKDRTGQIRTDARFVEFGGKKMILAEWCRQLCLNPKTVYSRMARGATDVEALGLA